MHPAVLCMALETDLDHILLILNEMFRYVECRYTDTYLTITRPPVSDHHRFP